MSDGARQQRKSSAAFHFAAGLGSGVVSAGLLQPADLLKTRVQQTGAASLRAALRHVLAQPHPVRQLWRGTTPSVIRTGCGSALYFGLLNQMRQYAARASAPAAAAAATTSSSASSSSLPKLGNAANLTTGALARVVAGLVLNPVTVLKVRYESSHFAYTSLSGAARDILRREGPRGFFAGFGATAVRDAPYAGLYVLLYEQAKARLGPAMSAAAGRVGKEELVEGDGGGSSARIPLPGATATAPPSGVAVNFVSGALAATLATALTNPFDAVKTRIQIAPQRYRNLWQAARLMLRDEGLRSMFGGLSLRIGRKAISSALTWTVYEEVIRRAERVLE